MKNVAVLDQRYQDRGRSLDMIAVGDGQRELPANWCHHLACSSACMDSNAVKMPSAPGLISAGER
jgi:hypothetical protein